MRALILFLAVYNPVCSEGAPIDLDGVDLSRNIQSVKGAACNELRQ